MNIDQIKPLGLAERLLIVMIVKMINNPIVMERLELAVRLAEQFSNRDRN